MKAPTGKLAFAYRTISELEAERDQLREELSAERRRAEVSAADANDAEREARELSDRLAAVAAERDQLRAEVEALRKDAERYRWLREMHRSPCGLVLTIAKVGMMDLTGWSGDDPDRYIDAAMAAKEGEL